jgi:hypothetical protein
LNEEKKHNPKSIERDPVVLFTVLEAARRQHDFKLAARMQDELSRRGVIIEYRGTIDD